jgi:hypothetical protein
MRLFYAGVSKHVPIKHMDRFEGAMKVAGVTIGANGAYHVNQGEPPTMPPPPLSQSHNLHLHHNHTTPTSINSH